MAARSKASVFGRSLAGIAGSNTARGHGCLSVVSVLCCAGRGLCVGLITRPEASYLMWCG